MHSVYMRFVVRPGLYWIPSRRQRVSRGKNVYRPSTIFFPVDQSPTMVLTYNIQTYIFISMCICTDCCIIGTLKRTFLFNIKPERALRNAIFVLARRHVNRKYWNFFRYAAFDGSFSPYSPVFFRCFWGVLDHGFDKSWKIVSPH